ncbi:MAG TPA: 3-hydroxyacyl-CoA dehydrogenase NAD-binding domain-containing protein, partial [Casimicrobiaceae bacterium]|nr:3-hydroxyacyl-CoA dehydrogenase NAD-binding domain-containing protein [Casimicrobiaceae bacterium]
METHPPTAGRHPSGPGVSNAGIRTIGIIGAGQMGNGIAHVISLAGYEVAINDLTEERVAAAMATINGH